MQTKQADTLNTQSNAEETHNENSNLIKHEDIDGTPFVLTTTEEGCFVRLGAYKLTPTMNNKEEIEFYMTYNMWKVIVCTTTAIIDFNKRNPDAIENKLDEIKKSTPSG